MARTRSELHEILCEVLGSRNVYFSPPSLLKYPCIKYEMAKPSVDHADNLRYRAMNCWTLTIIDTDPDSVIPGRLTERIQKYLSSDRVYTADNLYHFVYTLYF